MSKLWRSLNLPLINWEVELDLGWEKKCVISEISITAALTGDNSVDATGTTSATF